MNYKYGQISRILHEGLSTPRYLYSKDLPAWCSSSVVTQVEKIKLIFNEDREEKLLYRCYFPNKPIKLKKSVLSPKKILGEVTFYFWFYDKDKPDKTAVWGGNR